MSEPIDHESKAVQPRYGPRVWSCQVAQRWQAWLCRDVHALPLDLFRILAGLLCGVYFFSLLQQVPEFSSPEGLLDHELLQHIYWFTRLSLFHPGVGAWFFYGVFSLACVGALGIVLGYRVKLCAGVLFVLAVSAYRWNFVVMYVDDAVMHLLLFWLLLLPVGHTLAFGTWWRQRRGCLAAWCQVQVPGVSLRCFLANVGLIYLVAGLWKFESALWREGFAVYAVLRLPIAYTPDFWRPEALPLLRVANYLFLVLEPLLPFLLMQRRVRLLKWCGLVAQLAFHLGIIATLRIPFANLALMATAVLFFRQEIMHGLRRLAAGHDPIRVWPRSRWSGRLALILLVLLTLAMMRRLPVVGEIHKPAYAILWMAGIAQDYQLFNWIDRKNYAVRYRLEMASADAPPQALAPSMLFPRTIRAVLLQSYLHNVRWIAVPRVHRPSLKRSILARLAQRFCRLHSSPGRLTAWSRIQRIRPANAGLTQGIERLLMSFECTESGAVVCRTLIDRQDTGACHAVPASP